MLTIITDRSDNGNHFLCLSCRDGHQRSGRMTDNQVFCSNANFDHGSGGYEVRFVVTNCSGYSSRALSKEGDKTYKSMRQTAWYIDASQEDSGKRVFLPPDKAKDRGLWHDFD